MKKLIGYILAWLALIPAYATGMYFDNVYLIPVIGLALVAMIYRLFWD